MTDRELLQQARNALMYLWDGCPTDKDLIERLDDHLAQPEPEPTKLINVNGVLEKAGYIKKKEWVGLTDEEYEAMAEQYVTNCYFDTLKYAKAIEAKLKEKNA